MTLNIKPLSVPSKALSQSITSASMSFKLKNIKGWAKNNLGKNIDLVPGDFGANAFGVFRNETGSIMEIFEFDPSTIANPAITILKRGLDFNGDPDTENANYKLDWSAGATVVQLGTDTPQFLQWLKDYIDNIAIDGSPDSSTSIKGIGKVSVAPEVPTEPIFVGNNDPRVQFASETNNGNVEMATDTQAVDGDDVGDTGAPLVLTPGQVNSQIVKIAGIKKFGGDGSDGELNISSGTTSIDLGGAAVVVKNYTSISITGTGKLTFTNPHTNGTMIFIKSQGDVTITSSVVPAIDASGFGAAGSTNGSTNIFFQTKGGIDGNPSPAGAALGTFTISKMLKFLPLACGGGGAQCTTNGSNQYSGSGGASAVNSGITANSSQAGGVNPNPHQGGGRGGGSLLIECGGSYTCSATISVAGKNGVSSGDGRTGSGGGGGGSLFIFYNILVSNTGTYTVAGGTGGAGSIAAGGKGGDGYSLIALNTEFN